jgi:hypothetical protein
MSFSDIFRPFASQTIEAGSLSQTVALVFETDVAVARSVRVAVASGGIDAFIRFGDAYVEADADGILVCAGAAPSFFRVDRSISNIAIIAAGSGSPAVNVCTGQGA